MIHTTKLSNSFKVQSKNETEFYREQMNTLLESLSSKTEELSVTEKKRENALETMQNTLHQDQRRFNQSFDFLLENFRLSPNRTIEELTAWQQKGNGYDTSTGIFTAPRQGVYHITAVVMSLSGGTLFLSLKHNNEYTAGSLVSGDGHKTGTFDVVLNLQKGDKISVESRGTGYTVYSSINKYTTFSGHLIV
ncbi:C1QL [Mytilus coruscus]|uniref:C1QL n=1 Tax=Mytilus coruscus TaxID=42192 RepID=A0A6J8CWC8_MYTCO|nr:C1QL [Mytilus coruscus]